MIIGVRRKGAGLQCRNFVDSQKPAHLRCPFAFSPTSIIFPVERSLSRPRWERPRGEEPANTHVRSAGL